VPAIRRQVQFDERVVQLQPCAHVGTDGRVCRQFEQAFGFFRHAEFGGRAQHAVGLDAAQLRFLDLEVGSQLRADFRERHLEAGAHVGRAAHDLEFGAAVADFAHAEFVRVRMRCNIEHLADDDSGHGGSRGFHRLHFQAGHRQATEQFFGRDAGVHPFAQPALTDLHRVGLSGTGAGSAGRCRTAGAGP
jgi:hypothetical protein